MSDSTPNLPKGHNVPKQVTQDMMRKDAQAQADAGTEMMGTLGAKRKQLQEMNQMSRDNGAGLTNEMGEGLNKGDANDVY